VYPFLTGYALINFEPFLRPSLLTLLACFFVGWTNQSVCIAGLY